MTEETKNSVPFLPVVSITKLDAETGPLNIQILNSPAEGEPFPPVNDIIGMCLNAAFQLSNEAMGSMQQKIENLSKVTKENDE